jgi:UDP-galactopyranose mutase
LKYENITNGKEMSTSLVGEKLYDKIFKNYTFIPLKI